MFVALLRAPKHLRAASLSRRTVVAITAALWLLYGVGFAYWAWPVLFLGPDDPNTSMYVQVPRKEITGTFNDTLSTILRKQGFQPSSNSITSPDDSRNPTYVLQAQGAFIRVWSQTLPLSRDEAVNCGYTLSNESFGANDQRQYLVAVTSIPFFSGRAQNTVTELRDELLRDGYGVSSKPLPCQRPN